MGRGACLNLNLPPDRRGLIHDQDIDSLKGFRRLLDQTFAAGTSIGNLRLIRTESVTTDKVRLRITRAPVCPALAEFGLYAE